MARWRGDEQAPAALDIARRDHLAHRWVPVGEGRHREDVDVTAIAADRIMEQTGVRTDPNRIAWGSGKASGLNDGKWRRSSHPKRRRGGIAFMCIGIKLMVERV